MHPNDEAPGEQTEAQRAKTLRTQEASGVTSNTNQCEARFGNGMYLAQMYTPGTRSKLFKQTAADDATRWCWAWLTMSVYSQISGNPGDRPTVDGLREFPFQKTHRPTSETATRETERRESKHSECTTTIARVANGEQDIAGFAEIVKFLRDARSTNRDRGARLPVDCCAVCLVRAIPLALAARVVAQVDRHGKPRTSSQAQRSHAKNEASKQRTLGACQKRQERENAMASLKRKA
ncbi:hypothetical protein FI667_g12260, partial [Globisporangium splendens]